MISSGAFPPRYSCRYLVRLICRTRRAAACATILTLAVALILSVSSNAQSGVDPQTVHSVRLWHSPDRTRIVFDVSANVQHQMFSLKDPLRLVVDLKNVDLAQTLPSIDQQNPHITKIRSGRPSEGQLRFVFELTMPLHSQDFVLSPNELYGHRLVIDLSEVGIAAQGEKNSDSRALGNQKVSHPLAQNSRQSIEKYVAIPPSRPFLVAVDAGHGGEDPGALGYRGSQEKKITLAITKKLVAAIDRDPKLRAFMVRESDYYIKLHKRRELARARNADMFISIHADAFTKASARGFSVFALSQSGATSAMARALAAKENASDLIGGVSLADKDEVLAKVLVDLSMTNTISESVNFGGRVLNKLSQLGKLHSKRVEQAGFAVLKSPDIPSVLIETGFITNPEEEKRLLNDRYQAKIADAIYSAIKNYVAQSPFSTNSQYAAATQPAESVAQPDNVFNSLVRPKSPSYHKVKRGDSLSKIADRYGTSVKRLKSLNKLRNDTIVKGQRLRLPRSPTTVAGSGSSTASASKSSVIEPRPAHHTVRKGESLSAISSRYNITIQSLKRFNSLANNTVYIGQRLRLQAGAAPARAKPRVHLVRRGDTLSEIAERYGSTIRKIMRANAMRSRSVMVGQRLKIP